MYVVIFRANTAQLDSEYSQIAAKMRELALSQFGCLEFHAVCEGTQEIALSYWPDEASILAWKRHAEHQLAQQLGRERWYRDYRVEIAQIGRSYRFDGTQPA